MTKKNRRNLISHFQFPLPTSSIHNTSTLFFILLIIIVIEIAFLFSRKTDVLPKSLETYVSKVVEKCQSAKHRPSCYDEEIPKLMDVITMEETFAVTKKVQDLDREYVYCHVLGHELSARETAKDPDSWKEVIGRCPSGICSNGCIHGAFQERFRAESLPDARIEELKPILTDICEPRGSFNPTGLEKGTCYHALGHLTMYITDADIDKSLAICDEVATNISGSYYSPLCYDGAFMQIYQPLDPDDFALIEGKEQTRGTVENFCLPYSGEQLASCWSEAWPLYWQDIEASPQGLVKFCAKLSPEYSEGCYRDLVYVLTTQFNFSENKIIPYCSGLPPTVNGLCFANAASRMIETDWRNIDRAINLCSQAELNSVGERCYEELVLLASYNFHSGSSQQQQLCQTLPEEWQVKCPRI